MLAKVGWAQRTSSGPFNADALSSAGAATKTPSAAAGAKGKASAAGAGVPSTTNVARHTYTPRQLGHGTAPIGVAPTPSAASPSAKST